MADFDKSNDEKLEEAYNAFKNRFAAANEKSFNIIENYITEGYIKLLANLLVFLPKDRREATLLKLDGETREKVTEMLASFGEKSNSDAEVLSTAGFVLKNAGFYGKIAADEVIAGQDVYYINLISNHCNELFPENPLLAMNIEHYIIRLDILLEIDDRGIQKILRALDTSELAKALKIADSEIQEKIFRNMSRRAAAMLKEDMEFMGPIRKRDAFESQRKIIDVVKRLEESGEIVISAFGSIGVGDELIG